MYRSVNFLNRWINGINSDRLWDHPGQVQGWDSVCWGVLGIPLVENKKGLRLLVFCFKDCMVVWLSAFMVFIVLWFQDCLVSWFYRCMVLWFCSCMVLWFIVLWCYGFKNFTKLHISYFRAGIDLISMIFKILLNESSGVFGASPPPPSSPNFTKRVRSRNYEISQKHNNTNFTNAPIFPYRFKHLLVYLIA